MNENKPKAIALRHRGYSYNAISRKLGVAKGTLSYWLRDMVQSAAIKKRLQQRNILQASRRLVRFNKQRAGQARAQRLLEQTQAGREIKKISQRELFLVGTALYWAEGYNKTTWNVIFTNSDPRMHAIMLQFFMKVCHISPQRIKFQIQVHQVSQVASATAYWTKQLPLSKNQFLKPVVAISRGSKRIMPARLPYGTLRIKIDNVHLASKIKGWIDGLKQSM